MPEFINQSVRDLAWALSSPPLISKPAFSDASGLSVDTECLWPAAGWYSQLYEQSLAWLYRIDEDPGELNALISRQKDRRLGKYFESLWHFWLSKQSRYDIIENNLQIIIDGETLGEMDFILFDRQTEQTLHWELAVKFYLGVGDTSKLSSWFGPNQRDRLDLKTEHLCQRQSIISRQARVAQWLALQGIKIDRCSVIMKGRLYYPWQQSAASTVISPVQCEPLHMRSWWLSRKQFDKEVAEDELLIPLLNEGWMERIPTGGVRSFDTKKNIYENKSNKLIRFPLHVQLKNPRHSWDRAFLTEDDWPVKKT